ncbi:MAG TPA: hypothetical protein VM925_29190 [Labilithrix sp.]|nr:hypothetical protein [Labilithrix sp.]
MLLTAIVTKAELVALVESLTPLRIVIDERRGRSVTLGRPAAELVPGQGLRLRGDARVVWDVAGVAIPVTLQAWQLLLVPRVVSRPRTRVLAFEPVIEELDLKLVPGFLDDKIAGAIRDGIAQNRDKVAWDFVRTLSKRLALPARIAPAKTFEIRAVDGAVAVSATELRLEVRFEATIETRAPAPAPASDREPRKAARPVESARVVAR